MVDSVFEDDGSGSDFVMEEKPVSDRALRAPCSILSRPLLTMCCAEAQGEDREEARSRQSCTQEINTDHLEAKSGRQVCGIEETCKAR